MAAPRFALVGKEYEKTTTALLQAACKARKVPFVLYEAEGFDANANPPLNPGDALYRGGDGTVAKLIERHLIQPGVKTFYEDFDRAFLDDDTTQLESNGIPIPKTFPLTTVDSASLKQTVEALGGYPIVVKVLGGSHGVGVMKIDSFSALLSVVDFLWWNQHPAVLREFVDVRSSGRLIVLGDEVIDSIEYATEAGDFRSNREDVPKVCGKKFSKDIDQLAIRATKMHGVEFSGVDVLIDEAGKPYVLEVNFPCFFGRAQKCTGTDIAGAMVDYLLAKKIPSSKRRG